MSKLAVLASLWIACGSPSPSPGPAPSHGSQQRTASGADASSSGPEDQIDAAAPRFEPRAFAVTVTGSGRPIIFIPGLGCPGSVWDATVARTKGERHVIAVAGFAGRPPASPPLDAPLNATIRSELARYIRDRRLDHPVIVGHSMGGFLAVWLAATEPDLVGSVVAVDSAPTLGAGDPAWEAIARKRRDGWIAMKPAAFTTAVHAQFAGMFTDPKLHEDIIGAVTRSDQRTFADAYYELFTVDIRAELPKITVPMLAIVADGPYSDTIRSQLTKIPKHEVVVVPNTKHFVMHDDAEGFHRVLDAFLNRQ